MAYKADHGSGDRTPAGGPGRGPGGIGAAHPGGGGHSARQGGNGGQFMGTAQLSPHLRNLFMRSSPQNRQRLAPLFPGAFQTFTQQQMAAPRPQPKPVAAQPRPMASHPGMTLQSGLPGYTAFRPGYNFIGPGGM